MIDAESEAVKIPKLGGGKAHSGYSHTQRVSTPPPPSGLGGVCVEGGLVGNRRVPQGWENPVVQ